MGRLLVAFFVLAMAMAVLKMVVIALLIGGLALLIGGFIFRPRETIGFLLLGTLLTVINRYPVTGLCLLAILTIRTLVRPNRERPPPPDDPKLLE